MAEEDRLILLVDDDEAVRVSLELHFEDCGFFVKTAKSGEEALERCKEETPEAIIVDLRLPGIDGSELIRRLCPIQKTTIYIIYTGSMEFELPEDLKANERVSSTVFIKPLVDLDVLTDEVRRMLKE